MWCCRVTSYLLISAKVKRSAISDPFCRHSQSEFDWTVAICHEPSDIPHLSKVCGGVSFERRKTCNNVVRICPHSLRAERLSPTKRRDPIQRKKPRMAALRNTTHETTNQHHKKEPQNGKTHCFSSEQFATDCRSQFFCSWHFLAHGRQLSSHSRSNGEERHSGNHMHATGGFQNTSM